MFFITSVVPPSIELARERSRRYDHSVSRAQRLRPENVGCELGELLVQHRPFPLGDRALGPGDADLHLLGQRPQRAEAERLHPDLQFGDPLADHRVLAEAPLVDHLDQLVEVAPDRDRRSGAEAGALVHQGGDRDHPAVALAADQVLVRDVGALEEDLVELGLAGDLAQRTDLDPVLLHVADEVGEALVLRRVGVGARQEHAPLRLVRIGGPDLLAGDAPAAVLTHRLRLQRGEVGARLRLREPLAPDLLAERIGSRNRSFCSSVPWAMTTGPPMTSPRTFAGAGAFGAPSPR